MIERRNDVRKIKSGSTEPLFYVALVLKGTEDQYLKMLKYIQDKNGAQVVYQCKSLTYLRVSRDDGVRLKAIDPDAVVGAETEVKRGKVV